MASDDKKTLYIPKGDRGLWKAAERVADQHDTSLYKILREALDKQLPIIAAKPAPDERWEHIAPESEAQTA